MKSRIAVSFQLGVRINDPGLCRSKNGLSGSKSAVEWIRFGFIPLFFLTDSCRFVIPIRRWRGLHYCAGIVVVSISTAMRSHNKLQACSVRAAQPGNTGRARLMSGERIMSQCFSSQQLSRAGTLLVQRVNSGIASGAIPVLLNRIRSIILPSPNLGAIRTAARVEPGPFHWVPRAWLL